MKTFQSINHFISSKNTVITIGTFDGVHVGHKMILKKLVLSAKEMNCESVVLTFFPHPQMILQKNASIKLLNTINEKKELLESIGIDNLIIHPFDEEFSNLSAQEFVKTILVDRLKIKKIIIGYDHRFGKNRAANIDDLKIFGKEFNFEVIQITAQEINDIAVSSTKIRKAIQEGSIELANSFLGYNYSFSGKVVQGKQLGRTIGFPTANILIKENYKLIPKKGVYVVKVIVVGEVIFGMMNIGTRPTIDGENESIEVHLLDFEEDIYNEVITIEMLTFIREEQKFDSIALLQKQLLLDKEKAINYLFNVQ